jgi:hypothetical protein
MSTLDKFIPQVVSTILSDVNQWSEFDSIQIILIKGNESNVININNGVAEIKQWCLINSVNIQMDEFPNIDLGNKSLSGFQSEKEYYGKDRGKIDISLDEFNILKMEIQDGTKRYLFYLTNKNDEKTKKVRLRPTGASYLYCLGIKKNTPPEDWIDNMKENPKILKEIQSVFADTLKNEVANDIKIILKIDKSNDSNIFRKSWIRGNPNTITKTAARINSAFNKKVINHKKDKEAYLLIPDESKFTGIYTLHPSIKKFIPPK